MLVRGPHVREGDALVFRKLAERVRHGNATRNCIRIFDFHSELRAQFVVGKHGPGGYWVEADRRPHGRIVNQLAELRRGEGGGGPASHDHANKTVVTWFGS